MSHILCTTCSCDKLIGQGLWFTMYLKTGGLSKGLLGGEGMSFSSSTSSAWKKICLFFVFSCVSYLGKVQTAAGNLKMTIVATFCRFAAVLAPCRRRQPVARMPIFFQVRVCLHIFVLLSVFLCNVCVCDHECLCVLGEPLWASLDFPLKGTDWWKIEFWWMNIYP